MIPSVRNLGTSLPVSDLRLSFRVFIGLSGLWEADNPPQPLTPILLGCYSHATRHCIQIYVDPASLEVGG